LIRKWHLVLLGTAWIFGITAESTAYTVDYNFLYEEESVYESSKFTLDLSYDRNVNTLSNNVVENSGTTLDTAADLETSIGAIRKIEKSIYGYWFDTAFEYTYKNRERTYESGTSSDTTDNINIFRIKEFEDVYEGFLLYDYGDVGIKRYLSEQSPFYLFGQSLFYWEKSDSKNDSSDSIYASQNSDSEIREILAGTGIGYGKILDLGSYERVLIVQTELLKAGILRNKLPRSTILELLHLFRKKANQYNRLSEVQSILEK
jgi:hypothetical protein